MNHIASLKKGSTIVIVLFYIALILIAMVGMSYLLTRTIQSNRYISEGVQAGYSSESGIEIGLYQLKLRREGYENINPNSELPIGTGNNSFSYAIDYRTKKEGNEFTLPSSSEIDGGAELGKGVKKLALFYDDGNNLVPLRSDKDLVLITQDDLTPLGISPTGNIPMLEVKLSGMKNGKFETITATLPYQGANYPYRILSLSGSRVDVENEGFDSAPILFSDFLNTHDQVYILLRNALRVSNGTSSLPQNLKFQLKTTGQTAAYYKTITSLGSYNDVSVKRVARVEQDQIPELLSIVILQDKD